MNTKTKQARTSLSLNRLIAFFIAGDFLFLFVERRIEHDDVLSEELIAYLRMVFSAIGLPLSLLTAFKWHEKWIRARQLYMCFALAVGVAGLFFHNEERIFGEEKKAAGEQLEEAEEVEEEAEHAEQGEEGEDGQEEEEGKESEPPLLAPLAFTGLGMAGLLATLGRWRAEMTEA